MQEMRNDVRQARKGLIALLLVGCAIVFLAVMAPQAWATPDQDALRQTTLPPNTGIPVDRHGNPIQPDDCFRACDQPVYAMGGGFPANTDIDVCITEDALWVPGVTQIAPLVVDDACATVHTDGDGAFGPDLIWDTPLIVGQYDIVFDVNQNGVFDNGDSVNNPELDDWGLCVQECPVGGATLPMSKVGLLAPLAGLVALVGGAAAAAVVWKHRRS